MSARHKTPQAAIAMRNRARLRKGTKLDSIRPMEVDQRCESCGIRDDSSTPLVCDHDHRTGLFRGWLCSPCNRALGVMGESADALRALAVYAER